MRNHQLPMLPVHESKNSEKVVKFATSLENQVSGKYFNKICKAHEEGWLHGLYFTKTGKIRATFI